ncbi:hypothetical protein C7M84_004736 [Penaeus vannamei]|uniref:Uncharacterized protein n=1 Tax=Penaeus vannamei TaxID=6689 RepID=A0A423TJP0_PENVA|nr:hypothetical protein C7M84_004736 [Penaeus vannamei]
MNSTRVQSRSRFQDLFENQVFIVGTAEERLAHSVEGKTEIAGEITIRDVNVDIEIADLENRLINLDSELRTMNDTLDDAVSIHGSERVVEGSKTVVQGGLSAGILFAQQATLQDSVDVSGEHYPLTQTLLSIVRVNDSRKISGKKTFTSGLNITHLDAGFLDDISVSDILTTSGSQQVSGTVTMNTLRAHTVTLPDGGTVGGVDLSEELVLLDGDATLDQCIFGSGALVRGNVEVLSSIVSNMNVTHLFEDSLRVSGGSVSGTLLFNGNLSVEHLEAGAIMGVNTTEFMSTTVFINRPATLEGVLSVPLQVTVENDMLIRGLVNGEPFPGNDFLLRTTSTSLNFGSKSFHNVSFGTVSLLPGAKVDGLDTSSLVTLDTPQNITGRKVFTQGIEVLGDLDIDMKRIDGVNLDNLNASLSNSSHLEDLMIDLVFEQPVQVPALSYSGNLNGLDLLEIADDIVYDDEPLAVLSGLKLFTGGELEITSADFESTFNGHRFEDIVTTSSTSTITGKTTFEDHVIFNSIQVNGTVDGVNLDHFVNSSLYLDKSKQLVTGKKTFKDLLFAEDLNVTGIVSGIDFTRVFTKTGNQTFTAPQSFSYANFSDVETHQIDLSEGFTVNVNINFHEEVNVSHLDLRGTVNSLNVDEVLDDAVSLQDLSVDIVGKNFTSNTTFSTINLTKLNDRTFDDFLSHSILRSSPSANFTSDITVNGTMTTTSLVSSSVAVQGTIDGVDHKNLLENAVYVNQDYHFNKSILFSGNISSFGDINVNSLNEADLMTDYLLVSRSQNFTREVTMNNIITSNVSVGGKVNGYYLPDEVRTTMKQIPGQTVTGSMIITTPVEVLNQGSQRDQYQQCVERVDVEELFAKAWYVDAPALITADLSFMAPVQLLDGLVCKVEHTTEGICKLLNDTEAAISRFNALQNMRKTDFAEQCPSATQMFAKLEDSIFEGDHFVSVARPRRPSPTTPRRPLLSPNTTYVIMSLGRRCDSTLFEFQFHFGRSRTPSDAARVGLRT